MRARAETGFQKVRGPGRPRALQPAPLWRGLLPGTPAPPAPHLAASGGFRGGREALCPARRVRVLAWWSAHICVGASGGGWVGSVPVDFCIFRSVCRAPTDCPSLVLLGKEGEKLRPKE